MRKDASYPILSRKREHPKVLHLPTTCPVSFTVPWLEGASGLA
jgi:hypothetical protein